MFKNTNSIKNQLYRLAILQCLLVIVFWLYLIISKTMSLLNTVNYQISQNSEKILTQLDNDLSVLSRTTLFPVNRSLFANNDSLCSGLRKGSILRSVKTQTGTPPRFMITWALLLFQDQTISLIQESQKKTLSVSVLRVI